MIPFEEFQEKVLQAYEAIPPEFRERVSGPLVVRESHRHRDVRGMITLGECVHAPDFAGGGDLVSTVVLYYGSFVEAARRDPTFDVDDEIVETVRHEVRHHVEDQVGHAALRDLDWAEEQNEKRRQGQDFQPRFWRAGELWGDADDALRAVGRDLFHEVELPAADWETARRDGLVLRLRGEDLDIAGDEIEDDEEIFEFEGLGLTPREARAEHARAHGHGDDAPRGDASAAPGASAASEFAGDLVVVLRRRRRLLDVFRRRPS
ncbi:MAG: metallopeptidase family protein [Planctomycetes bacterium]|nr:metallopeptidase family protein [Planctomycetota bacterium]